MTLKAWLRSPVADGNRLFIHGTNATELPPRANVVRDQSDPGKAYMAALEKDFEHITPAVGRPCSQCYTSGQYHGQLSPSLATHT